MSWLRSAAGRIAGFESVVVALAAPFLLFPTLRPLLTGVALAALLGVWLAHWIGAGRPGARTPLDGPLLMLALTVPIAVWASAFPELSIPKLTGIILGLATFRAMVNAVQSPRRLWVASLVFLALGLGLVLVGLVGAHWHVKWQALRPILTSLPRLLEGLPGAEGGIHLNELAGALLLFLPVSLALVWAPGLGRGWAATALRLAALLLMLVTGTVVFLTQSRSAWIGALVAIGAMAWLRWPRFRWPMVAGLLVLVVVPLYLGPQAALQSVFAPPDPDALNRMADTADWDDRVVLFGRALYTIREFAFTGCGLGAFRRVAYVFFPGFRSIFGSDVGHAHNVFLQVGLDLGVPGLVAYLALVGTALWIGWRVARSPRSPSSGGEFRWLGLGIVGSLVAFHVYGLTDTVALGAKPGVAFWMLLGLAAALWIVTGQGLPQKSGSTGPDGAGAP